MMIISFFYLFCCISSRLNDTLALKETEAKALAALKEAEKQAIAASVTAHQDAANAVQALKTAQRKISLQAALTRTNEDKASQKLKEDSAGGDEARKSNLYASGRSVLQASGGAHQLATEAAALRVSKKDKILSSHRDKQPEEIMT